MLLLLLLLLQHVHDYSGRMRGKSNLHDIAGTAAAARRSRIQQLRRGIFRDVAYAGGGAIGVACGMRMENMGQTRAGAYWRVYL